jgi:aminoglycoside phosphotransferase family enzyme
MSSGCAQTRLEDKVGFLRERAWPGAEIEEIETHMSWVFLAGDRAYKLKKPTWHTFLDYRTLEARRRDCRAEVELNQALAPGVYLGVEPITVDASGKLSVGGEGTVVEWLVVMRRLDSASLLDHRITAGQATTDDLDPVLDVLVDFYRETTKRQSTPEQYRESLTGMLSLDLGDLSRPDYGLDPARVTRLGELLQARLEGLDALDARASRLIDGHGDLRPEHIVCGPSPLVIDRLSFDPRLRRVDPYFDLALLAVECDRLGAPSLGRHVLRGFSKRVDDPTPRRVIDLYLALRSTTRARLSIAHLRDGNHDRSHWLQRCNAYLTIAERHIEATSHAT